MTDDERRAFKNLILLCKPHHDLIDKRHPGRYSVSDLEGWKISREGAAKRALDELGPIPEDTLETLLRGNAISLEASTVSVGGQGGSAPGAGGGGGGVIGSGAGGPGGPGGGGHVLEGTPGTEPGAGGGGAGAMGPDPAGGEGGGGGEAARAFIEVAPDTKLHLGVGSGGTEGGAGGDTWVAVERPDGTLEEVVRAAGGTGGRSGPALRDEREGPALRVTSAFLADDAQVRDGLAFVLAGGWKSYFVSEFPGVVNAAFVVIVEPGVRGPRVTELEFEIFGDGESRGSDNLLVELAEKDPPSFSLAFRVMGIEVARAGEWQVSVRSGGVELARVPFQILQARRG